MITSHLHRTWGDSSQEVLGRWIAWLKFKGTSTPEPKLLRPCLVGVSIDLLVGGCVQICDSSLGNGITTMIIIIMVMMIVLLLSLSLLSLYYYWLILIDILIWKQRCERPRFGQSPFATFLHESTHPDKKYGCTCHFNIASPTGKPQEQNSLHKIKLHNWKPKNQKKTNNYKKTKKT